MKILKKLTCVCAAAILAAGCMITANAYVCKQGDANADGVINIADVTEIQKYIVESISGDDMFRVVSDLNGDGVINITDATFLQMKIVELNPDPIGFPAMDGIDVSAWQENVDFNKIKAAGFEFVIIRAGYGNEISQKDNQFEAHYKAAKDAGLKVGTYWYSYAADEADARLEAEVFREAIAGKNFELPVFYDIEDNMHINYSKSELTAIINAFCTSMSEHNYYAGVYSDQYFFNNLIDIESLENAQTIWLAEYDNKMTIDCDVWQYASDGEVDGIDGYFDMNKCLVDYPSIITQGGFNGY